jgi:hypothetical protein
VPDDEPIIGDSTMNDQRASPCGAESHKTAAIPLFATRRRRSRR